jgi:plasmid maintenance system antidote protein VapI
VIDRPARVRRLQTAEQARAEAGVPPVHLPPDSRLASRDLAREVVPVAEAQIYALEHFAEYLTSRMRGHSLREVARESGVHYTTISRLLSGAREPSLQTALRLLKALGVSQRRR